MSSIDILLATYNGELYLEDQLDSIFNQTYTCFNLYVRDDQSEDATLEILRHYQKKYPEKMVVTINEKREGALSNFWKLIHTSKSPYLMFADQDDVWFPQKIELCLQEIQREDQKTPLLLHTDLEVVDKNLGKLSSSFWEYAKLDPYKGREFARLLIQNVITGCTCMMNRALVDLLPKQPPEAMMHDWWVALVAAAFGKIITLPRALVLYRQHEKNVLGVTQMTGRSAIKKGYSTIFKSNQWRIESEKKYQQANYFLKLYEKKLRQDHVIILSTIAKTSHMHWLERKFFFFKYKLFWHGALRNCLRFPLSYPY